MTKRPTILQFDEQCDRIDNDALAALYRVSGYGGRVDLIGVDRLKEVLFAMDSAFGCFAFLGDTLIGTVRVLSDDHGCSSIAEMAIDPAYDEVGAAHGLFRWVTAAFPHTCTYVDCTPGSEAFLMDAGYRPQAQMVQFERPPRSDLSTECDVETPWTIEPLSARVTHEGICRVLPAAGHATEQEWLMASDFPQSFRRAGVFSFFVFHEDELIGFAHGNTDNKTVSYLFMVVVDSSHQGKGVGRALLREVCRTLGNTHVYASAYRNSVGFFEAVGFHLRRDVALCRRMPIFRIGPRPGTQGVNRVGRWRRLVDSI